MRKVLALLVILLVLLTGCEDGIMSGKVVYKDYTPAHSSVMFIMSGKTMIPITQFHPDSWSIRIQNGEKSRWFYVSEKTFDEIQIGDTLEVQENGEAKITH